MGGDAASELADNTLDMMVARESKADDWMPDNEMLDEVLLCGWRLFPCPLILINGSVADISDLVAGTETSGVTLTWVRSSALTVSTWHADVSVAQVHFK